MFTTSSIAGFGRKWIGFTQSLWEHCPRFHRPPSPSPALVCRTTPAQPHKSLSASDPDAPHAPRGVMLPGGDIYRSAGFDSSGAKASCFDRGKVASANSELLSIKSRRFRPDFSQFGKNGAMKIVAG